MGKLLLQGNVIDVQRGGGEGGFTRGKAVLRDVNRTGKTVTVHFQNENTCAVDDETGFF